MTSSMQAKLASIAVDPVSDRDAQIVRNRLVFLLGGGSGTPSVPRYTLSLSVTKVAIGVGSAEAPQFVFGQVKSERIAMRGQYVLKDAGGTVLANGRREAVAEIDLPDQGFAAQAARRDGAQRAGEELAEMLRLALAQDLLRH